MKPNPIVGQGTPLHRWQTSPRMAELALISVEQLVPEGHRAVIIAPIQTMRCSAAVACCRGWPHWGGPSN